MSISTMLKKFSIAITATSALGALSLPAQAANIKVNMTVDNSYSLFYGTQTAATNFVGSDYNWTTTETYNFNLPSNQYLYIVTSSDVAVAQGFLGQFENIDTGYKFYSNDPQWQVMATGLGSNAPYSGSAADLSLLTNEILDANGGGNPSNGWTALTAGPANGSTPWGPRPNIDAAAKWVWYSSNGDPDPTTPGYNHDEWLVFRIPVAATPTSVPEPSSIVGLLGIGAFAIGSVLKRKKQ
jgi:PEP-CTERM motif